MPNWNSNQIEIKTKVNPKRFMIKNREWKFSLCFEKIIPLWEWDYNKAIEKWWCKWDIAELDDNKRTGESERTFDIEKEKWEYTIIWFYETPWCPPIWFLTQLYYFLKRKDKFSTVRNSYFEGWCWVLGIWENGSDYDLWFDGYDVSRSSSLDAYVTNNRDKKEVLEEFFDTIYTKDKALEELEKIKDSIDEEEYREELENIEDLA